MNEIRIDMDFFDHLLGCMANQKYISEQTKETQEEWQMIIAIAWNAGMEILNIERKKIKR